MSHDSVVTPDLQTFSSALEVVKSGHPLFPTLPESTSDMPVITVVASSTEQDLQGDTMAITALQDMCDVPIGQSVFRSHTYDLPDNYFGKSVVTPVIVQTSGVADLHTAYGVYIKDDANRKTYDQIENFGARHGVSGGFMITQYSYDGDVDDWFAPIIIEHVRKLEDSIVGIPASQRSWVEHAIEGLFERCIREDNGEEALRLAPAFKGLFSNKYKELSKSLRSEGLRKDLEARPVRSLKGHDKTKLFWEPLKKHFVFQQGARSRIVERQEIPDIFKSFQQENENAMTKKASVPETTTEPITLIVPPEASESDVETSEDEEGTKTATEDEETQEEAPTSAESVPDVVLDPVKQYQLAQFNEMGTRLYGEAWKSAESSEVRSIDLDVSKSLLTFALDIAIKSAADGKMNGTKHVQAYAQVLHDISKSMGGAEVCSTADGNSNEDDGDDSAQGATKALEPVLKAMEAQTQAVGNLVDAVKTSQDLETSMKAVSESLELAQKELALVNLKHKKAVSDVNALADSVQSLKNMPLGNPTSFNRSVEAQQGTVDLKDFLSINSASVETLEEAWAHTSVEVKTLGDGTTLSYRHWPAGVGKGVRPALLPAQITKMSTSARYDYEQGSEAWVAVVPGYTLEAALVR